MLIVSFRRAGYGLISFLGEESERTKSTLHVQYAPARPGMFVRHSGRTMNRYAGCVPTLLAHHPQASLDGVIPLVEVDSLAPASAEMPALMIGLYT